MKLTDIGTPIAERTLVFDGIHEVTVLIGAPFKSQEYDGAFVCAYRISGLDNEVRFSVGLDSVQALCLTLFKIHSELVSEKFQPGRLTWLESASLGFPTGDSVRDLAP